MKSNNKNTIDIDKILKKFEDKLTINNINKESLLDLVSNISKILTLNSSNDKSKISKIEVQIELMFQDILESKLIKNECSLSVFDDFPILIWSSGIDAKCNYFNKAWLKFRGRTFDEEFGEGWVEGVHVDDVNSCISKYTEAFSNRKPFILEYRLRRYDGTYRNIIDYGKPFYKNNCEFLGYIGSCYDATEKILNENKIKEQDELFIKVTNSAQDAIVVINNEENIVFWNKMAEKIFLCPAEEVIGKNFHNLFVPKKYHEAYKAGFRHFIKTGDGNAIGQTLELTSYNKFGVEFPVELSLSSTLIKEQWHAVGIIRDITERKKILEKLENLNNTKNQLISIIGHDLRSSFLTINGFSKLIKDRIEKHTTSEISNMSDTIYNTSILAQRLLENMILWAKSQSNSILVEFTELNLSQIINDCININTTNLQSKNINVELSIDDSTIIKTDKNILSTVIRNVINNAIKYSNNSNSIKIKSSINEKEIIISVIDSGIGFNDETLKKIINRQNVVSNAGTNNEKGTGMGLMLCFSILEKINGNIKIISELNIGTEVQIIVPIFGTWDLGNGI